MKTRLLTICLILLSFAANAQGGKLDEKRDELKSAKVAFLTEKLDLTPTEAQKFWPVYNQFEEDQFRLRKQKLGSYLKEMDEAAIDQLSEKEAGDLLNKMEATETDLAQLKKKLIGDLRQILSAKKIIKLKKAEDEFNKKLLQQFRKRRK